MVDSFRALCAELVSKIRYTWSDIPDDVCELMTRPAPQPPAEGEVAELVEWLGEEAVDYEMIGESDQAQRCLRAAELLQRQHPQPVPVAIPGEEYHEDMGPVTWWRLPVEEPPWVGTPNDSDWPGYHTHFTPAPPTPCNAHALPFPTSEGPSNAS